MPKYSGLTFKGALVLAKALSGLGNEEIAESSGIHHSKVARYFSEHDAYYPPAYLFRPLCAALGNEIIFDWLEEQRSGAVNMKKIRDVAGLSEAVRDVNGKVVGLNTSTLEAISDNLLDKSERAILACKLDIIAATVSLAAGRLRGKEEATDDH